MINYRRVTTKLLEHGPMGLREFSECTGWSYNRCFKLLREMLMDGFLQQPKRGAYQLPLNKKMCK